MAREHRPDHRPLHPERVLSDYPIAVIETGPWPGQLALGPFPADSASARVIAAWGASTVIGLTEPAEMTMLGRPDMAEHLAAAGLAWVGAPIPDYAAPDGSFEQAWPALRATLIRRLSAGEKILIHCRGGRGRSGTVAAALLIASGIGPAEALLMVRAARPGAVETQEQESWLSRQCTPEAPALHA